MSKLLLNRRTFVQRALLAGRRPPRVVFLNPGSPDERVIGPFWTTTARLMHRAAEALGLRLDVQFSGLDRRELQRQALQLARSPIPPDYVVITNSQQSGPDVMAALARTPAKLMMIHSDLTAEQRQRFGHEREHFPQWIGTALPDNARGGARLMAELCAQLGARGETTPRVLGITGWRVEPVSLERARGVQAWLDQHGRGRTLQLVYSDYSAADGERKAEVLLARYPEANILWAGNDSMALGAQQAVQRRGARVLVGGMGGWPQALKSIADGGLAATVEGHYLIGAIALVLLHDYHHGLDFAAAGGPLQRLDFLRLRNRAQLLREGPTLFDSAERMDFRAASRVLAPRSGPHRFDIDTLLRGTTA